ncbi:MAG: RNA polymerase sigma factor [Myxococcaceae bacterium]|nr:RNA polymerase sigma factor [Myxococcaceae bacterium]
MGAGFTAPPVWDTERLKAFKEGRQEVLAALFQAHANAVAARLRHAHRMTGAKLFPSAADLESAVLEVFTRAFAPKARESFDGVRPFEGFLMGIARNVALETARKGRREGDHDDAELAVLPDDAAGPDVVVENGELDAILAQFRAGLSDELRSVYDARFVEHLSQEAAAQALGLTRIQLRRKERDLKVQLLGLLKAHGYLEGGTVKGWTITREVAS